MIFAMVFWFCVYRKAFAAKDRFIFTDRFMKSLTLKLAALLMVYIYIVGIAGLDVHSCRASGKDYVVAAITGVAGLDCEDIHPESHGHHCTHGQDSNHENHCTHGQRVCECEVEVNNCCSNTYHALTISGSGDGQRIAINHFPAPRFHSHPLLPVLQRLPFGIHRYAERKRAVDRSSHRRLRFPGQTVFRFPHLIESIRLPGLTSPPLLGVGTFQPVTF